MSNVEAANPMDGQKKRYGERLYEKNSEGKYRCFFCNKELRANFSRHISRHEMDGDAVNEELRHAILQGLPLPAPASNVYDSNYVPSTSLGKRPGMGGMTGSSSRTQLEQQFYQLVFDVSLHCHPDLRYTPLARKFLALVEDQIVSPLHTTLDSFYNGAYSIGEKLVSSRGSHPQDLGDMKVLLDLFHRSYRLELCKGRLDQGVYGQKCSLCLGEPLSSELQLPCSGKCLRTFHLSCAIKSENVHVTQISTLSSGYSCYCSDCAKGRQVLRWDPQRRQYFFVDFVPYDPSEASEAPEPLLISKDSISKGMEVKKGAGIELTLTSSVETVEGTPNGQGMGVPVSAPPAVKRKLNEEDNKHKDEMWFDPFWCVWRYTTSHASSARSQRQADEISCYELSDDSTDTEEPEIPHSHPSGQVFPF